ncbi:ATP-binding protein [Pyrococcus kukulkanii]|uniref:ATP-binding protein n=1 Tax=Pyrococcus kukulkanii TaxID=1609559 RepID=UPI001D0FCB29|nr:AAA family ATPase [Pyrococcus kukulkanii]
MLKEITEEYLGALNRISIIEREAKLPSGPDIKAIIGVRRVGKTVLMLQRVGELLEKGENAVYVSFDEPEIRKLNHRELAEEVRREFPSGNVYLFLDEVQEWEEWDARIRWLHEVGDFDIYISGSSSTLLSSKIPSRLRGRYISRVILPFSFREVSSQDTRTFRNRGKIRKVLDDYLRWGRLSRSLDVQV